MDTDIINIYNCRYFTNVKKDLFDKITEGNHQQIGKNSIALSSNS